MNAKLNLKLFEKYCNLFGYSKLNHLINLIVVNMPLFFLPISKVVNYPTPPLRQALPNPNPAMDPAALTSHRQPPECLITQV